MSMLKLMPTTELPLLSRALTAVATKRHTLPVPMQRACRYAIVVFPVLLAACDQMRGLVPKSDDTEARFQLERDDQGRMVRLDKVTGEVTIVKGEALSAAIPSREAARTGIERPAVRAVPETVPIVPAPREVDERIPPGISESALIPSGAPVGTLPASVPAATPHLAAGARVTLIRPSPVFLTARENQTPLEVLGHGAAAKVLRTEGEWYFIEFQSPRWGRRVGFLKSAAVDHGEQPMDLSVSEPPLGPVDLSVPDPALTPLDLSVPER